MEKTFKLNIGDVTVEEIRNVKLDWPRWLGDFHPTSEFQSVAEIFSKMVGLKGEKREEQLMRLLKMGVAIVDLDGSSPFRRTGEANLPVEIATISFQNSRISFRMLVRSPGVIPSR